jgi:hypothetical protein
MKKHTTRMRIVTMFAVSAAGVTAALPVAAAADAAAVSKGEHCLHWNIGVNSAGRFTFDVKCSVKNRVTGLGSTLARALKRAAGGTDSQELASLLVQASEFARKLPDDAGFDYYLKNRGQVSPEERRFLDYAFTGQAEGWVGRARFLGAVHRSFTVTSNDIISKGYERAQINLSVIPLVKVTAHDGVIIYSGNHSPSRRPLMRIEAGTQLVWLNEDRLAYEKAGGSFCHVLVYRPDGSPLLGWTRCTADGQASD